MILFQAIIHMCADLIWGNKTFHILLPRVLMKKYSADISLMVSFSKNIVQSHCNTMPSRSTHLILHNLQGTLIKF